METGFACYCEAEILERVKGGFGSYSFEANKVSTFQSDFQAARYCADLLYFINTNDSRRERRIIIFQEQVIKGHKSSVSLNSGEQIVAAYF